MTPRSNPLDPRNVLWILASLGLLVGANGAFAHNQLLPPMSCDPEWGADEHHYFLNDAGSGRGVLHDGRVSDCDGDLLTPSRDGDIDQGFGAVLLAFGEDSQPCLGINRHHTGTIVAQDSVTGHGPAILVAADYSRPGGDPCGDGIIEPCDENPPAPSTATFPANVVEDAVNHAVYNGITGPGGVGCNPLDQVERGDFTLGAATTVVPPFGHGANGAFYVFIQPDTNVPNVPLAGHVWTR